LAISGCTPASNYEGNLVLVVQLDKNVRLSVRKNGHCAFNVDENDEEGEDNF
jgi:hypothetical protein